MNGVSGGGAPLPAVDGEVADVDATVVGLDAVGDPVGVEDAVGSGDSVGEADGAPLHPDTAPRVLSNAISTQNGRNEPRARSGPAGRADEPASASTPG